jgi:hypothetical protein
MITNLNFYNFISFSFDANFIFKAIEIITNYNLPILLSISIVITGLTIYISSGSRWVRRLINGIERLVLVTAAGTVIYDSWGRPITKPIEPGNKGAGTNNPGNNTGTGKGPGSGSGSGSGTGVTN